MNPVAMDVRLRTHAVSDRGRKRSRNEDCCAIWEAGDAEGGERRGALLVVADGMGGSFAGDVASRLAVDAVLRAFAAASVEDDPLDGLRGALESANREVHAASRSRPDWNGMGTTCTALLVRGREMWIAHVGDSRAYLVRDGHALQLTEDHSLVAALVERHETTPDQTRADGRHYLVTRCVGPRESVDVDASRLDTTLAPGDALVLCSDGLFGQVADREIVALIANPSLEKGCRDLIELANRRGGPDNITVVAARLEAPGIRQVQAGIARLEAPEPRARQRGLDFARARAFASRGPLAGLLVPIAVGLSIVALVLAWWSSGGWTR